jgi:hypothetical protein
MKGRPDLRLSVGKIKYLNTDLDLISKDDLTPLGKAFEADGACCLHVTYGQDKLWYATFEADAISREAESSIKVLIAIIESLDRSSKRLWRSCMIREFNIGYDCGSEPWGFNQKLSHELLQRIARNRASLRITLYPPERITRARMAARRKK